MDNKEVNRDEKGDVIIPEPTEEFWEEEAKAIWSYVFRHQLPEGTFIKVDYEKWADGTIRQDLPKFNLVKFPLFQRKEGDNNDQWIREANKYRGYLEHFFRPVLAKGFSERGFPMEIDITDIVIPKERLEQIMAFISESRLEVHQDFILMLIAKIENIYISDVAFYDRPEERRRIKKFPEEVSNLITVLKRSEVDYSNSSDEKPNAELEQITFQYNTEPSIKLTDYGLISSILDAIKDYYTEGVHQDWEKNLEQLPGVYTENQLPGTFRYRICKALHNFFKAVKAFPFNGKRTTDSEVYAIARILDFAHVKFKDREGIEFDIIGDKAEVLKNVRNAIIRKDEVLTYYPTRIMDYHLQPKLQKLGLYFDDTFLLLNRGAYNEYDFRRVTMLAKRFKLEKLQPELLHIFDCLRERQFQIGHQFESPLNKEIIQNEDYSAWKALFKAGRGNIPLAELAFRLTGEERFYNFSEQLSLELVKKALMDYYKYHPYEFELDFYQSTVTPGEQFQSFRLDITGKLNIPSKRFLPVFTKQFYRFLLNEAPPGPKDLMPSERYFGIIALFFDMTGCLGPNPGSEERVIQLVKTWFEIKQAN